MQKSITARLSLRRSLEDLAKAKTPRQRQIAEDMVHVDTYLAAKYEAEEGVGPPVPPEDRPKLDPAVVRRFGTYV